MTQLTIKSRKFKLEFNFYLQGSYVYLGDEQACHGGGFRGNTVTANEDTFESECKKWYKSHMYKYNDAYERDFYENND